MELTDWHNSSIIRSNRGKKTKMRLKQCVFDSSVMDGRVIMEYYKGRIRRHPGQHFDLFDSIPLPHNTWSTRVECNVMPRGRYRLTVDYLLPPFLA